MPILHMETDSVRSVGQQLKSNSGHIQAEYQNLNGSVQRLTGAWRGNSADQFTQQIQSLLSQVQQLSQQGDELANRLEREVAEWEQVSQFLGNSGATLGGVKQSSPNSLGQLNANINSNTSQQDIQAISTPFPLHDTPPLQYALMSNAAYADSGLPDGYDPDSWLRIDVDDYEGMDLKHGGYYGAAFFNKDAEELVIAHRGTDGRTHGGSDWADDNRKIYFQNTPSQFEDSRKFVTLVKGRIQTLDDGAYQINTLTHTGHSLGGALADLNAATDDVKAITFDNPGAYEILTKDKNGFEDYDRSNHMAWQSNPNLVNQLNTQAGCAQQMTPDIEDYEFSKTKAAVIGPSYMLYKGVEKTKIDHNLDAMIAGMDSKTGFPIEYIPECADRVDYGDKDLK